MPEQETIQLKPGESSAIKLKVVATAGYEWFCDPETSKIITIKKEGIMERQSPPAMYGGTATEVFTITALNKGQETLTFKQQRRWESDKPAKEEKKFTIIVE